MLRIAHRMFNGQFRFGCVQVTHWTSIETTAADGEHAITNRKLDFRAIGECSIFSLSPRINAAHTIVYTTTTTNDPKDEYQALTRYAAYACVLVFVLSLLHGWVGEAKRIQAEEITAAQFQSSLNVWSEAMYWILCCSSNSSSQWLENSVLVFVRLEKKLNRLICSRLLVHWRNLKRGLERNFSTSI